MKKCFFVLLAVLLAVFLISCDEPKADAPVTSEVPEAPAYIDDFKFYTGETVIFKEDFATAESAEKFCPEHAGGQEKGHDNFVNTFKSCSGVGCIYGNSAWVDFKDLDSSNTYTLEYKIKLDPSYNLKAVDNKNTSVLSFNYGEAVAWASDFISFVSEEDGLYIYDGTYGKLDTVKYKLEADTWYTIKTVFAPVAEDKTEMKTVIDRKSVV